MESITGARKVVFCDYTDSDSNHNATLELGVSHDGKIHYEPRFAPEFFEDGKSVRFTDYRGKIHLPPNVGSMIAITGDISGVINSPAFIIGSSDVNLIIGKSSGLELSILTNGPIIINGEMYRYGSGIISKSRLNTYGKHFDVFLDEYMEYLAKSKKAPSITRSRLFDEANFGESEIKYTHIDTCIHHNLIFLSKGGGITNIFYTPPFDEEIPSSQKLHNMKTKYKRLERYKSYAILEENFKKATTINNIMDTLQVDIDHMSSKVQEAKCDRVIRSRNRVHTKKYEKLDHTEATGQKKDVVSTRNDKNENINVPDKSDNKA